MRGTITVLTPTVDTRSGGLVEAVESVADQTRRPDEHLIRLDHDRNGGHATLNRLIRRVTTDYVMVLPDDDVLWPNHLELLGAVLDENPSIDVASSWCDTLGRDFVLYNVAELTPEMVKRRSCVAHTALFRAKWVHLFEWALEPGYDWLMWRRMAGAGARFHVTPEVTFTYRLSGGNESHGEQP